MYANIDNSVVSKINELRVLAAGNKPDIILLTEIKPKCGAPPDTRNFNISGYTPFTNDLNDLDVRGVCIYVKNCFKASTVNIPDHNFKDYITVSISTQNSSVLIQTIYRSGSADKAHALDPDLRILLKKTAELPGYNQKVTVGDFNYSKINWTPEPVLPDRFTCNSSEAKFIDTLRDIHVIQHIDQPTRYPYKADSKHKPTIDDLLISTYETDIANITYDASIGASDHVTINFKLQLRSSISVDVTQRKILRYDKANFDLIRKELDVDWDILLDGKSVQESIDTFEAAYNNVVKKYVPCHTVGSQHEKPKWMSLATWHKVRRKHSKWIKYLNTKQPKDYEEYAKVRNEVTHHNKRERKNFEKSISRDARRNPKGVRNYMKSTGAVKSSIPNLTRKDGSKTTSDKEISETLAEQYSSVFTDEDLNNIPEFPLKPLITNKLTSFTFNEKKVEKILQQLDPKKAPGLDQLHPRILKETAKVIAHPITLIFRKSQAAGILPTQWLMAAITPIFKKGNRSDPSNYRPVSLTCILCKIMEKLVVEQTIAHAKANLLLNPNQHGFTSGKSVTTNHLEVFNKWTEALMHDLPVDILFLDYSKAFDTVPHARLIKQVESFGITGEALAWIKAFLSGRQQQVIANKQHSSWKPVRSGVPQGSVLGPVLFSLFVNDVPTITDNKVTMFADDTKLHAVLTNPDHGAQLQQDLKRLEDWAQRNQMKFHPSKCVVMHLGNHNKDFKYTMTKEDGSLHVLDEAIIEKDLGVEVDWSFSFTFHCKQKINTATRMLNYIRRSFQYIDKEVLLLLYKEMVRPHLENFSTVWAPAQKFNSDALERVQRRATRMIPELKGLSYKERLQSLRLETLQYRRKRADLLEAYRIMNNIHDIDTNCDCSICPGKKMFEYAPSDTATRGHSRKLYIQQATGKRQNFFSTRVAPLWNSLSEETVTARTIEIFKRSLQKDIGHTAYDYNW